MSEFKKGNRVIGNDTLSDSLFYGTVDDVFDDGCVYGTRDSGGRFVARPWHLTKIDDEPKPLRFEDVRDGDTITVEVEDRFTLTGTAIVNPNKSVDVAGAGWSFARQPDGSWRTDYSLIKATLTAHTPAEPKITDPAPAEAAALAGDERKEAH